MLTILGVGVAASAPAVAVVNSTPAAVQMAAQYGPPTSGYDGHVHYYNCRGPYYGSAGSLIYYCYADWDWIAEVFWGQHDGPVYVGAVWYA